MAYAARSDIERLMSQFVLDPTTHPTVLQTDTIIADTEQEINVALSSTNVSVPVEEPAYFVDWLGLVTSYGATAAILKSMFPSASGPAETPAYAFWEARYRAALEGIVSGTLLPPETPRGFRVQPATYFTRNPNKEEFLGDIAEPFFKRRDARSGLG